MRKHHDSSELHPSSHKQPKMKLNRNTALQSSQVLLVPYSAHHVPRYSQWMSSPELLALTASEELTLEEELANQQSWRDDPTKLTFISVNSAAWNAKNHAGETSLKEHSGQEQVLGVVDDRNADMRGDVNMFFFDDEEDEVAGEVNIMVAEPSSRGQGFGKCVLLMFLWYVLAYSKPLMEEYRGGADKGTNLTAFVAKIDKENEISIKMFEGVGFRKVREEANYFGEVELRMEVKSAGEKVEQFIKGTKLKLLSYKLGDEG